MLTPYFCREMYIDLCPLFQEYSGRKLYLKTFVIKLQKNVNICVYIHRSLCVCMHMCVCVFVCICLQAGIQYILVYAKLNKYVNIFIFLAIITHQIVFILYVCKSGTNGDGV